MSLFNHMEMDQMIGHPKISGILDMSNSSAKRDKSHEIVIVSNQSNLLFVSDCEFVCEVGPYLLFVRRDLKDVARLKKSEKETVVSFNRPWYVLDYKYVFQLNDKNMIEYDKISTGRYITHSEKHEKHILLYTGLLLIVVLVLMLC